MAAASATPFAPPFKLSSPKHLPRTRALKLNLKGTHQNLIARKRATLSLPSISWSKSSHRSTPSAPSSTVATRAYVSGPAFDLPENDPKINGTEEIAELKPIDAISWGLLWKLISRHKWRVLVSILTLFGCTSCTLAMPIYSGRFFEVLIGARPEPIWKLLSKVGILYTLEPIFTIIFVINMNSIWEKVMSSLRAQIFQRVLIQKVEFFDKYKVGELTALLTSDLGSLKNIVSENISRDRGFRAISEASYSTLCKSYWDALLTFCSVRPAGTCFGPTYAYSVSATVYKRTTVNVFKAHGSAQAAIADCVTETFAAIRTVLEYENSGITLGIFKSINESLTRVAVYVSLMALYCLGGSKVKAGELAVGTMVSFIGYTFTLTFAVQGVVNTFGDLRGAFAAADRINSVVSGAEIDEALASALEKDLKRRNLHDPNLEALLINTSNGKEQTRSAGYMSSLKSANDVRNLARSGDIRLEDVHFSYPLRPDVEILRGLDLTLKCGTVTALVGPSGAGKSTVVQLLARFYEPTKGRITVAGEDLRSFDKSEWARAVSLVNQEPVLFSVSVGENIAYGLPDEYVSKDDVIKAAKAANAHEFIISLPQGYDTLVGERGGLLSGGQRQRIAIARALLKDAPILILDEATSALDTVSERLVQEALNRLMKGRTTLVIAHRLSTVQNAHQIALCSEGKISELGTHAELLDHKGLYASLVGTQRLAFE
ncbi:ABC transporter B family member [Striga asiatica]|uniref:ABC transporter B family member n=1 Tax=Striga asiatica TaxID=4170 RepID=A0A5A7PRS8_STRAF|nr:ABC transporter B family member [Striga asiatica]